MHYHPPETESTGRRQVELAPHQPGDLPQAGFGAEFHADPSVGGDRATVFFAGDDAAAKKTLSVIAERAGFHPVDAGPLRNAAVLENVAILWIHLALAGGQGRDFAFVMKKRT